MNRKDKVLENRLRLMLLRQGYRLMKSRHRDPRAYDYGGYMIVGAYDNFVVAGAYPAAYSMSLPDVEAWAMRDRRRAGARLAMVPESHHLVPKKGCPTP
jgi:hypothetical protein